MGNLGPQAPFKSSMVMGINDAALDLEIIRPWPNEKVGFEVCAQLAARLQGPDVLPDGGLSKQSALAIIQELKTANERVYAAGYKPDVLALYQIKQAASLDLHVRGARAAEAFMAKAAAEGGSLTNVGENTPESAAHDNQLAKLDLHNRPVAEYLVGVGNSELPQGGVVGKEMAHPKRQSNSPSISNSLTEHSAKAASEKTAFGQDLLAKVKQVGLQARHTPGAFAKEHPLLTLGAAGGLGAGAYLGGKALMGKKEAQVQSPSSMEEELAALALGHQKKADEDMSMGDLGMAGAGGAAGAGGGDPGQVQQLKSMLSALVGKYHQMPSAEGQLATAGLAQHPDGMQVMASVLDRAKTAEEADDILQQILHHQGQAGQLASPELIAAIQALLAEHGGGGGEEGGEMAGAGMPPAAAAPDAAPPAEDKMAALMAELKKIAEGGSLTGVGENTPESAAKDNQLAELDQHNRSTKQYLEGQGGTKFPNKGQVYAPQRNEAHDNPVKTDTVPSRETTSKSASKNGNGKTNGAVRSPTSKLSAEEMEYVEQLKKVALEWGPKLPALLTQKEKVAHIQAIHGRAPSERAAYVAALAS